LAGCGKDSRTASAFGAGNVRWASFPVDLQVDAALQDGGPAQEDLLAAVAFWENRAGKRLFSLRAWQEGQLPYTGNVTDPETLLANALLFQNPWPNTRDWTPQVAGKTVVHSTGEHINHAVIFLNGQTPLCGGPCDQPGEHEQTSRRRLIAHELGHFLGLTHVSDLHNIMYPEIQAGGALDTETVDEHWLVHLTE
jgi:hypothetical protein